MASLARTKRSLPKAPAIAISLAALDRLSDRATIFASLLSLLKQTTSLSDARILHAFSKKHRYDQTTFLGNWIIRMYGNCGGMIDALAAFNNLRSANLRSWTILMNGYVKNGHGAKGLDCFRELQSKGLKADHVVCICALEACALAGALEEGRQIHGLVLERGFESKVTVATALVSMYGKCGSLRDARMVFEKMEARNVVSWTAMMVGYVHNGQSEQALSLFVQMQIDGIQPNPVTFLCAIDACAAVAALETGRKIHAAVVHSLDEGEVVMGNALVNMYGKCGSVEEAKNVFDKILVRNVVSWSSMISALAQNGYEKEAIDLFSHMLREGFKPNHFTFLSILTACCHVGSVELGKYFFHAMNQNHGLSPTVQHYVCLVDLFGRAGQLDDAEDLLNAMPFADDPRGWLALLTACKLHGDLKRGERVANKVFELDPDNSAPYVVLSDMYAAAKSSDDPTKSRWLEAKEGQG